MYSPEVLDHFQHPRNAGELKDADVKVTVENPACGDILELAIKVSDGRIVEARFRTRGCVSAIACSSALTEMIKDKTIREARQLRREQIVAILGGLTNESIHASHLAIDGLSAALKQL